MSFLLLVACSTHARADRGFQGKTRGGLGASSGSKSGPTHLPNTPIRKLIRDISLTLSVPARKKVAPTVEEIAALAVRHKGYVVRRSLTSIVVKIPMQNLGTGVKEIEGLGEVKARSIRTRDVTAQYYDLELRIRNAEKLLQRLRKLADKSGKVEVLLKVERELGRVSTQLEILKGRLNRLRNQTSYGTVTVYVHYNPPLGPVGLLFVGVFKVIKLLFVLEW